MSSRDIALGLFGVVVGSIFTVLTVFVPLALIPIGIAAAAIVVVWAMIEIAPS